MELGDEIDDSDIDVIHWVGKPLSAGDKAALVARGKTPRPRQVLLKFSSRRAKDIVMRARGKLDSKVSKIWMTDDLTQRRSQLAFQARDRKKAGLLDDTWVFGSKIWAKFPDAVIREIRSLKDLPAKPAA